MKTLLKITYCLLIFSFIWLFNEVQAQDLTSPIEQLYEQVKAEEQRKEDSLRKAQLDKKFLMKQLFTHQKGVCGCGLKHFKTLENLVGVSGQLKADTTKYFFQFGKVYQQMGGHTPLKKE